MTYVQDIKKIADKDGITPKFSLLLGYSNFTQEQFYKKYLFYKKQEMFKQAIRLLKSYKLEKYKSELFFFLVQVAEYRAQTLWAKSVSKSREDERYLKEIQKLNDFCNEIQTYGGYKKAIKTKDPSIRKISYFTDKNLTITIKSHKLCVLIVDLFKEHYFANKELMVKDIGKNKNLNPRQYDKQFILGLKPLINYLSKETIQWKSKNKIYDFVSEYISLLDPNINISSAKIKDTLKAK